MHTGMIPVFEEKLKKQKSKLKKYLKNTPRDKIDRERVRTLLTEINKIKRIIVLSNLLKKKHKVVKNIKDDGVTCYCVCPVCATEITVVETHEKVG